jgi:hypothetical protein
MVKSIYINGGSNTVDWKAFFQRIFKDNGDYELAFFEPISKTKLAELELFTNTEITGDLLDFLLQTNGIQNKILGDFVVFNDDKIKEYHLLHRKFLKAAQVVQHNNYLFFADNGCGENFGFIVKNGVLIPQEVGVYYPIENEFRIVAADFETWASEWYSGKLST